MYWNRLNFSVVPRRNGSRNRSAASSLADMQGSEVEAIAGPCLAFRDRHRMVRRLAVAKGYQHSTKEDDHQPNPEQRSSTDVALFDALGHDGRLNRLAPEFLDRQMQHAKNESRQREG